jgi:hypothetical protein
MPKSPAVSKLISLRSSRGTSSAQVRVRTAKICSGVRRSAFRISSASGPSGCSVRYWVGSSSSPRLKRAGWLAGTVRSGELAAHRAGDHRQGRLDGRIVEEIERAQLVEIATRPAEPVDCSGRREHEAQLVDQARDQAHLARVIAFGLRGFARRKPALQLTGADTDQAGKRRLRHLRNGGMQDDDRVAGVNRLPAAEVRLVDPGGQLSASLGDLRRIVRSAAGRSFSRWISRAAAAGSRVWAGCFVSFPR